VPRCLSCGQRWNGTHPSCSGGAPITEPAPAASAEPLPQDLGLSGYTLERAVARGGFGSLFAGRREWDGRAVAIKVAHPGLPVATAQLAREANALKTIGAPTVPELFESGALQAGNGYLVMELIEQPTLADVLARAPGPMSPDDFATSALSVVNAVAAVHERSLVHCDLKPENIFITPSPPGARLIDFGLARVALPPAATPTPFRMVSTAFEGTAEYMSPEQCAGQTDLDARSDLYSVGVILYELLTGRTPFFGAQPDVHQAHLTRRPTRPSELAPTSAGVEDIVLKLLAKDRTRRFESARALREALLEVLAKKEASVSRVAPAAELPRSTQTRRAMAVLFLALRSDALAVQAAVAGYGGQLAHSSGDRCAAVFDLDAGENPVKRALRAAEGLLDTGAVSAALVDVSPVTVQRRPNGAVRFLGSVFSRSDRYPDADRAYILFTTAATEVLPELRFVPVPGRDGILQLAPAADAPQTASFYRVGVEALIGREDEVEALVSGARAAVERRVPSIATVFSEPGYGKSHLGSALVRELQERFPEAQVFSLRSREPLQGDVDETLRGLLQRALELPEVTPSNAPGDRGHRALVEKLGPGLGDELWPPVAAMLGWMGQDAPELKRLGAAPGVLRAMARRAAGEALRACARNRPVFVILDDAHFAEDVSLDALEYAALPEAALPMWICLLARPALERARPSLGSRAAHHQHLRLEPLSEGAAEELCRALLRPASNVPAAAVARIVERTQRVPLFLVELVHGLKRQGLIRPRTGGTWYLATDELELGVPDLPLVEWLADRELGGLPPELVPYARLCAELDTEFTASEVEGIVHELEHSGSAADFPLDPGHATHRLRELGLLAEPRPTVLAFRNPLLRAAVSRGVTQAWRERLHRAAFHFYLHHWAEPEERRLPRIAWHAAGAGMREEAAALYLDLAEGARERHAYLEAEATYSRAIELLTEPMDLRQLAAYKGRGLMRYRVGRYEDSLADFAHARKLARARNDVRAEVELLLDEATALDWINDYTRSENRVTEAGSLMLRVESEELLARLKLAIGRSQFRNGRRKEASASLEEAATLAEKLENAGYETLVVSLMMLGVVLPDLGRIDEAEQVLQRVVTLCTERRDRLHLGSAINNRRNLWVAKKDLERALEDQRRFMQLGRELGMVGWEYFAEYNLGELHYQAGQLSEADPHMRRAIELETRHPEIAPKPQAVLLRARLLAYRGEREQARALLDAVQEGITRAKAHGRGGADLVPSEQVLFRMVELYTRDSAAVEWRALRSDSTKHSVEQEPIEVAEFMGLALLRQGLVHEGLWQLDEARAMTGKIPNVMEARIRGTLANALEGLQGLPPPVPR